MMERSKLEGKADRLGGRLRISRFNQLEEIKFNEVKLFRLGGKLRDLGEKAGRLGGNLRISIFSQGGEKADRLGRKA